MKPTKVKIRSLCVQMLKTLTPAETSTPKGGSDDPHGNFKEASTLRGG